jgi:hypothetical protein
MVYVGLNIRIAFGKNELMGGRGEEKRREVNSLSRSKARPEFL